MRSRIWLALWIAAALLAPAAFAQKITLIYPNRSGSQWPLFLAKEGGYYQKYGLDVDLKFVVHPGSIAALVSGESGGIRKVEHGIADGTELDALISRRQEARAPETIVERLVVRIAGTL